MVRVGCTFFRIVCYGLIGQTPHHPGLCPAEHLTFPFTVVGPLEMVEIMDGWDAFLRVLRYILPELDGCREPAPQVVEIGELGAKRGTGGFYE